MSTWSDRFGWRHAGKQTHADRLRRLEGGFDDDPPEPGRHGLEAIDLAEPDRRSPGDRLPVDAGLRVDAIAGDALALAHVFGEIGQRGLARPAAIPFGGTGALG